MNTEKTKEFESELWKILYQPSPETVNAVMAIIQEAYRRGQKDGITETAKGQSV